MQNDSSPSDSTIGSERVDHFLELSPRRFQLILTAVILVRLLIQLTLHVDGLAIVSMEGPTRALMGYYITPTSFLDTSVWLPTPFFLFFLVWTITTQAYVGIILLNSLFGLLSLLLLCSITYSLFRSRLSGLLVLVIAATFPYHIFVSMDFLPEPVFHTTLLLGLYFLLRWMDSGRTACLYGASCSLLVGTTVREEVWLFVGVYCLFLLYGLGSEVRSRGRSLTAGLSLALPNMMIATSYVVFRHAVLLEGADALAVVTARGDPLSGSAGSSAVLQQLLTYPMLMVIAQPVVVLIAAIGLYSLWRRGTYQVRVYITFVLAQIGLVFLAGSVGAVATGFPQRIILLNVLLLLPLFIASLQVLFAGSRTVAVALLISALAYNGLIIANYPSAQRSDRYSSVVEVGKYLRESRALGLVSPDANILHQTEPGLSAWDTHVLPLVYGYPENVFVDKLFEPQEHDSLGSQDVELLLYPVNFYPGRADESLFATLPAAQVQTLLHENSVDVIVTNSFSAMADEVPQSFELVAVFADYRLLARQNVDGLRSLFSRRNEGPAGTGAWTPVKWAMGVSLEGFEKERTLASPLFFDLYLTGCDTNYSVSLQLVRSSATHSFLHTPDSSVCRLFEARDRAMVVRIHTEIPGSFESGNYDVRVSVLDDNGHPLSIRRASAAAHPSSDRYSVSLGKHTFIGSKGRVVSDFLSGKNRDYAVLVKTIALMI